MVLTRIAAVKKSVARLWQKKENLDGLAAKTPRREEGEAAASHDPAHTRFPAIACSRHARRDGEAQPDDHVSGLSGEAHLKDIRS